MNPPRNKIRDPAIRIGVRGRADVGSDAARGPIAGEHVEELLFGEKWVSSSQPM